MPRLDRPLIVIAAIAISLAIGLAVVLGVTGGLRSSNSASLIGGPFSLADQNGKIVTEKNLQGRPSLIFFGFTHCPDVCPTTLFDMSQVLGALGSDADRVNALFVSVDPERDTAQAMKDYVSSFDPHIQGLTGSSDDVAKIIKAYRVYAKKVPLPDGDYTMDHSALVYLLDKNGQFVGSFDMKKTPEEAAADLKRYF